LNVELKIMNLERAFEYRIMNKEYPISKFSFVS